MLSRQFLQPDRSTQQLTSPPSRLHLAIPAERDTGGLLFLIASPLCLRSVGEATGELFCDCGGELMAAAIA